MLAQTSTNKKALIEIQIMHHYIIILLIFKIVIINCFFVLSIFLLKTSKNTQANHRFASYFAK
jgi:hypothetical protein